MSETSGKGKSTMKRDFLHIIPSILILTIVLVGCGSVPTSAPTSVPVETLTTESVPTDTTVISSTPDPCSPGQIEEVAQKVHNHMREFDDASILASNMPREQLANAIAELQRIRREAEDEPIPPCLTDLKTFQVEHMNSVINTLVAFVAGTDQQSLEQGILAAREQHDQYLVELARILGITVVPTTPISLGTPPETATP
jgi:hypothetical protein